MGMEVLDGHCAREPDRGAQSPKMNARHAARGYFIVHNVASHHARWLDLRYQRGRRLRGHLASVNIGEILSEVEPRPTPRMARSILGRRQVVQFGICPSIAHSSHALFTRCHPVGAQRGLPPGYLPSAAAGQRNPLLKASHDSVLHERCDGTVAQPVGAPLRRSHVRSCLWTSVHESRILLHLPSDRSLRRKIARPKGDMSACRAWRGLLTEARKLGRSFIARASAS